MSSFIEDLETRRQLGGCFYLVVPLVEDDRELEELIHQATRVEKAVELMLDGKTPIWEMLELVEDAVPSMDQYVNEVEQNLYEQLLWSPNLRAT